MPVDMENIKKLREKTGAGVLDCKSALEKTGGDMDKATEILRKKGFQVAEKKAARVTSEGRVGAYIDPQGKVGVLLELDCETDFVARNQVMEELSRDLSLHIATTNPLAIDQEDTSEGGKGVPKEKFLMNQPFIKDRTHSVRDIVTSSIAKLGENIKVKRFARFETTQGRIASYIHFNSKIGVLLELANSQIEDEGMEQLLKDLCMQVAATNPLVVSREALPPDVLEKQKELFRSAASGKPPQIVEKIIQGKMESFYKENCLLEQPFIKDDTQSVKDIFSKGVAKVGKDLRIKRFARFEIGR